MVNTPLKRSAYQALLESPAAGPRSTSCSDGGLEESRTSRLSWTQATLLCVSYVLVAVMASVATAAVLLQGRTTHLSRRPVPMVPAAKPVSASVIFGVALRPDDGYFNMSAHPICSWLAEGQTGANASGQGLPAAPAQCSPTIPKQWLQLAGANCYCCVTGANVCREPPRIFYHQYLGNPQPEDWPRIMLSFQAYLMTQDLRHTELWVWVDNRSAAAHSQAASLFDTFPGSIKLRQFDFAALTKDSPWEQDSLLGNATLVKEVAQKAASRTAAPLTDLARLLILWNHGGFWLDSHMVLLRNLHPLLSITYQFVARGTNQQLLLLRSGSPLAQRMMELATTIPLNHPQLQEVVINGTCRPMGYRPVGGYGDIYSKCLLPLARHLNNTGAPDAVLHEMPLGWWDPFLPDCRSSHEPITNAQWQDVARSYLLMHTTALSKSYVPPLSPVSRSSAIIAAFFDRCRHAECVPQQGADLLDFDFQGSSLLLAQKTPRLVRKLLWVFRVA